MGGESTKPLRLENEFIDHPKFQDVEIVEAEKTHDKLIKIRCPVTGQSTISEWENNLKVTKGFNKENLLLPKFHSFDNQGLCGNSGMLNVTVG